MSSDDSAFGLAPRTTRTPWTYLGVSRSAFFRLMSAGAAPLPLRLPGTRHVWRLTDLDRWLAKVPTGRKPRKSAPPAA
jgi:predicted DNA-binding transcriptional regulator AlpA